MNEEPKVDFSPHLKSDSLVLLKVGTKGGVVTTCVPYFVAAQFMSDFYRPADPMPKYGALNERVVDVAAGEVVTGTVSVWLWADVTAIWVEPFTNADQAALQRVTELKRSNDLHERELSLRERESKKPREPWEGDE